MSTKTHSKRPTSNPLVDSRVQLSTIVKFGSQYVKVTPLVNGQVLYANNLTQAQQWESQIAKASEVFAKTLLSGQLTATGEMKEDFVQPGKTTVLATRQGLQRFDQNSHPLGLTSYPSTIQAPNTFDDYGRAIMGLLGRGISQVQSVSSTMEVDSRYTYSDTDLYDSDVEPLYSSDDDTRKIPLKKRPPPSSTSDDTTSDEESSSSTSPTSKRAPITSKPVTSDEETDSRSSTEAKETDTTQRASFQGTHTLKLSKDQQETLEAIDRIFSIYRSHFEKVKDHKQAYRGTARELLTSLKSHREQEGNIRVCADKQSAVSWKTTRDILLLMFDILRKDIETSNIQSPKQLKELQIRVIQKRVTQR